MIHVFRRFLPLMLGPAGALLGALSGMALHQLICRSVRYLWQPWLGWSWLAGLLVYPALGFLLAIPFVYVYPGGPERMRSAFGRAQDLHLRMWIAIFVAAYLPVGIGVMYTRWWSAPTLPIPFTDIYLYPGSRGDLVSVMVAVALFGPFCGVGVERMLRGLPRELRLLIGPPLATAMAMGAVLAVALAAGASVATWPDGAPYGPLLQPLSNAGWDSGLLVTLLTVISGCVAGCFATLTVCIPALAGIPDVAPAAARRRWSLPLLATALLGVLAITALLQGYGLDSFRWADIPIPPGRTRVVGTLVAPTDQDVLQLRAESGGFHLLEFPSPLASGRHLVSIPGFELPTGRADTMRYLLDIPDYAPNQEVMVQPSWPVRTGISEYSGPVRFERVPLAESVQRDGRHHLELTPGSNRQWSFDVTRHASELVLDPAVASRWAFLAARVSYSGEWIYTPGWSVVFVRVEVGGREVYSTILGDEGHSLEGETLLLADADPSTPPPAVTVRLQPATRPGETLSLPVVGRGMEPGEPLVQSRMGTSVLAVRAGDELVLAPEPGGTFAAAGIVTLDKTAPELVLERRGDDGAWHVVDGELLLMSPARLRVTGPDSSVDGVVVLAGAQGDDSLSAIAPLRR